MTLTENQPEARDGGRGRVQPVKGASEGKSSELRAPKDTKEEQALGHTAHRGP